MSCEKYCNPYVNLVQYCSSYCKSNCFSSCEEIVEIEYPPPPFTMSFDEDKKVDHPKSHVISNNLIISSCIIGGFFLIAACAIIIFNVYTRWKQSRRRGNSQVLDGGDEEFLDENHGPVLDHPIWYIRTVGLQQSVIDSITVLKYRKDEGVIEGVDCSVCLSEFEEDESLRLLPKCNHAFHIPCIDQWLRSHKNCPLCRAPVVKDGEVGLTEAVSSNSDGVEDTQVENLEENRGELGENGDSEEETSPNEVILKIDLPCFDLRNGGCRVQSDLADNRRVVEGDLQPMRRSVSMDSPSASKIYAAMANVLVEDREGRSSSKDQQLNKLKSAKRESSGSSIYRLMKSSSIGRTLQKKRTMSMKRSVSSSRNFSSARHTRSQTSILPL